MGLKCKDKSLDLIRILIITHFSDVSPYRIFGRHYYVLGSRSQKYQRISVLLHLCRLWLRNHALCCCFQNSSEVSQWVLESMDNQVAKMDDQFYILHELVHRDARVSGKFGPKCDLNKRVNNQNREDS